MRAVYQRVAEARVDVSDRTVGSIGRGALILLGVAEGDEDRDAAALAEKVANLRVMADDEGKMNRSLLDVGGAALVVSQFTLLGDCRRGRRPSFIGAARPEEGRRLYALFCEKLRALGLEVAEGIFQAHMHVHLTNDGPVTILLDSRQAF